MRWIRTLVALCAALLVLAATATAAPGNSAAWERLKSLVGEWDGTVSHGSETVPVTISYTLVSSGTSLMERLTTPDGADMVTMYHPDGPRILMTHYCSGGNQPRMRAPAPKGDVNRIVFSFVDATNLPDPKVEHMRSLVVKFDDADHFTQEWTHRKAGKEEVGVFRYTRKK